MLYAARSHIGLVRQVNEDGFAVHADFRPFRLIVVADGMGGASAGEVASKIAVDTVSDYVQSGLRNEGCDPQQLMQEAVFAANQRIWEVAQASEAYLGMGTTIVAALFDDTEVTIGHVGDSRGYLFQDGNLQQVTQDHSLVAELVRRGQITEDEAVRHPQRNIVTRSLGTVAHSYPDVATRRWRPGDVLLLCTDGLTNLVTSSELGDYLRELSGARSEADVDRLADALVQVALDRGGHDNITLVLVVHREEGKAE
ncbi:protein phosphatase PrpC [Alicyclobacillus cellulosilyticus]|uniref:Protein phosphatase PrpC n=1 Tax=Alicyclobacillus cellulosilyticus TaxID=1003997 RepID=A0A917KBL4_9BACL|nr:Stp1/IreP family PP2C-type Ser/Thr phosphatase [Alicyclobacillus cellulosilyticus]GGJ08176.1 protein phosphatase PrpC [Alicyclobacillus cellulosilyticus]